MVTEVQNFITLDEIKEIKEFYGSDTFEHSGMHPEVKTKMQWANNPLADWILKDILHEKLIPIVGENYRVSKGCGVFQRCYIPFGMHIDSKRRINPGRKIGNAESPGTALLIPLDEGPYFNTVFWKNYLLDDDEKHKLFKEFIDMPDSKVVDNKTGALCDLEFCWSDPVKKLYNHLEFDTLYNWKLGSAAYWDRNQLHAASDFTKHYPYKDAITIFFE